MTDFMEYVVKAIYYSAFILGVVSLFSGAISEPCDGRRDRLLIAIGLLLVALLMKGAS